MIIAGVPITKQALAFSCASISNTLLTDIFNLFHLDLFLSVYLVPSSWFYVAQAIFVVWNPLNDVLYGWLSDSSRLGTEGAGRRIPTLRWGGPLWCLVMLLPWFPWGPPGSWLIGLQYLIVLCLFDLIFTVIAMAHGALITDASNKESERVSLYWTATVVRMIAVLPFTQLAYYVWDKHDLHYFKLVIYLLCVVACVGFFVTCAYVKEVPTAKIESEEKSDVGLLKFGLQLLKHRNLLVFVSVNFLQEFQQYFLSQFSVILLQVLLGGLGTSTRATLLTLSLLMPKLFSLPLILLNSRCSSFTLWRAGFYAKLVITLLAIAISCATPLENIRPYVIAVYFLLVNGANAIYHLFPLTMGDLIDEDQVMFQRRHSMATSFWAFNALVTKPGYTLASVIGSKVLWLYGYTTTGADQPAPNDSTEANQGLYWACFWLLTVIPLVSPLLQLVMWRWYRLHSTRLQHVKQEILRIRGH